MYLFEYDTSMPGLLEVFRRHFVNILNNMPGMRYICEDFLRQSISYIILGNKNYTQHLVA